MTSVYFVGGPRHGKVRLVKGSLPQEMCIEGCRYIRTDEYEYTLKQPAKQLQFEFMS